MNTTLRHWRYAAVLLTLCLGLSPLGKALGQTLVPFSGSNSVACGTNTTLQDHNGASNYSSNANGYTVLNAGGTATINISGSYATESGYDFIRIYSGVGTGGPLVAGPFSGSGTINYTGGAGVTLTVQFTSDGSVTNTGFNLAVTYTGTCPVVVLVPSSGSNTSPCGSNITLQDHAGAGNYGNSANGYTVLNGGGTATINISGSYATESGYDFIRIYSGVGTGGPLVAGPFSGSGTINYTGGAGVTLTVQFTSDVSVTNTGFNLAVTYTGSCSVSGNDNCANAISIATLPYTSAVLSNATATDDNVGPGCGGGPYKNLWWTVTGICGTMTATTCQAGTNFDTELHVFTGNCGSLTEVGCNDDDGVCSGSILRSTYTWTATAGTTYYISAGSYGSASATGNLQLGVTAAALTPSVAPAGISGNTTICPGGTATLTATGGTIGSGAVVEWFTGSCGGTLVGTGNSISVSPGTTTDYYVRYSGTCNTTTCAVTTVVVNAPPTVTCGSYGPVCVDAPDVTLNGTPTGGTWSGTGVTGNSFDPSVGTQTLTYNYTETGYQLSSIAFAPRSTAGGGSLSLSDDQVSGAIPIGFNFDFYGNTYTNLYVSSNGFITFNSGSGSGCCAGQLLPNASDPNNLIAPAWDDLYAPGGGTITYLSSGPVGSRTMVVSYSGINYCCTSGSPMVTTQVVLYETSNIIEIHTTSINSINPGTMGIENAAGTMATVVPGRNASAWSATNEGWRFSRPNCSNSCQTTINVSELPTPANAGGPQTICESGTTTGLGGNTPLVGTGTWSIVGGGTGSFAPNANDPNATFTHTGGAGPVQLRWTISNPPCTDSFFDVFVTVNPLPTVTCPADITGVCNLDAPFALSGATPAGGTYSGTGVSGGIFDPGVAGAGTHTITYTYTDGNTCTNSCTFTIDVAGATTWYADADGDGMGDPGSPLQACTQPPGYVADNSDLCPTDPNKSDPGQCGCGVPDTDTDGDLTADCEDGCPTDPNKTWEGVCGCGTPDVDGDGDTVMDCLDGCPTDPNKFEPGVCGCGVPDSDTDGDSVLDCNDLCPLDPLKTAPGSCGCGQAEPGTACDDGDPNTGNDMVNANCQCLGQPLDCAGIPGGPALPGTPCDDLDPGTANDVYDANCDCAGTPTSQTVALTLNTDDDGDQTSWEIIPQGGGTPLCSGANYANNSTITLTCPLADGCYELRVMDSFGDGMTIGGYLLHDAQNQRIIDNAGNGDFGTLSQIANSGGFCLPLGSDHVRPSRCDLENLLPTDWTAAQENPAVSAQFGQGDQTDDGYQFWFFDPNGTYSRRILVTHANSDPSFPWGPARCTHLRFTSMVTSPLPHNKLLNVRVRSRVNGVYSPFGPACRLRIDPVAQCPTTQLLDDINSPQHSCGITNVLLDGSQYLYAQYVGNAVTYQWEFDDINSAYLRRIAAGSSALHLSAWATLPLQYNTTYSVRVRVSYDGGASWCPWGAACTITTAPVPPGQQQGRGVQALPADDGATFQLWPNPNRGDRVHVRADGLPLEARSAELALVDLSGRTVIAQQVPVTDGLVQHVLDLEGRAVPGLYTVVLRTQDSERALRLVVQ